MWSCDVLSHIRTPVGTTSYRKPSLHILKHVYSPSVEVFSSHKQTSSVGIQTSGQALWGLIKATPHWLLMPLLVNGFIVWLVWLVPIQQCQGWSNVFLTTFEPWTVPRHGAIVYCVGPERISHCWVLFSRLNRQEAVRARALAKY